MRCDKCGYNKAGCECPAVTVTWEQAAKSGVEINHKLHARIAELENELATLKETAAAMEKYIYAIPALCRGDEVACALHVSQPIKELRENNNSLKQIVRELLSVISQAEDDAWTKNQLMYSTAKMMRDCRTKALDLLQPLLQQPERT